MNKSAWTARIPPQHCEVVTYTCTHNHTYTRTYVQSHAILYPASPTGGRIKMHLLTLWPFNPKSTSFLGYPKIIIHFYTKFEHFWIICFYVMLQTNRWPRTFYPGPCRPTESAWVISTQNNTPIHWIDSPLFLIQTDLASKSNCNSDSNYLCSCPLHSQNWQNLLGRFIHLVHCLFHKIVTSAKEITCLPQFLFVVL